MKVFGDPRARAKARRYIVWGIEDGIVCASFIASIALAGWVFHIIFTALGVAWPCAGGAPGAQGRGRTVRIAVRGNPVRGGAVGRPMAGSRPRGARHVGAAGDIKRHRLRRSSNQQAVKTQ